MASSTELRRLVAEHQIRDVLSEQEQRILQMAAKGKSVRGIQQLYGFPTEEAAQRAVDRIAEKLRAMSGGDGRVSGGAASPPQAPRPASTSTPFDPPPARRGRGGHNRRDRAADEAKVLAKLQVFEMSPKAIRELLGCSEGHARTLVLRLRAEGKIHQSRRDGVVPYYAAGAGETVDPLAVQAPAPEPASSGDQDERSRVEAELEKLQHTLLAWDIEAALEKLLEIRRRGGLGPDAERRLGVAITATHTVIEPPSLPTDELRAMGLWWDA